MELLYAEASDGPEILALQKCAYYPEAALYDDFTIPPLTQTIEELLVQFDDHTFLKAVEDGRIVGSVRARREGDTCYIGRLVVHPDFQNRGIGTALMQRIEEYVPALRYELFTGTQSKRNLYLYEKLGYREFRTERQTDKVQIVFLEKHK